MGLAPQMTMMLVTTAPLAIVPMVLAMAIDCTVDTVTAMPPPAPAMILAVIRPAPNKHLFIQLMLLLFGVLLLLPAQVSGWG